MYLNRRCLDTISGDATIFEKGPIESLARDGQLVAYKHQRLLAADGHLRDKNHLEELWNSGKSAMEGVGVDVSEEY